MIKIYGRRRNRRINTHVCKREKIREGIKKGPMLSNVVAHYIY